MVSCPTDRGPRYKRRRCGLRIKRQNGQARARSIGSVALWHEEPSQLPTSEWHGHARGIEIWRTTSGGAPLVEENHMTIDGKESYDYAAIWWNGKAQNAQGIWCDAEINDQGCTGFAVTWKGEQIVMSGEYESGGKRFAWRETLERKSEDSLTQTLHIGQSAGELKLVSTTALTKAKDAFAADHSQ